ncbi:hypothetical protein OESDEN_20332 [Oesophagostomum dentatum]|uniref:Saposin B-type domain-containing protein n=1 Tax=Oesophagostomum dentatum TaxID=61180 RepID=A0A0B1S8Z5_OESDE|nr:hypothetical protein OESDEN_20332 [Oesophagostomum dentatum]
MTSAIFLLLTVVISSLPQTESYDIECLWCLNVVFNAQENFGDNITSATNVQLDEYFERTCRVDQRKSPLLAAVCYDMFKNHREELFNDLRNNVSAIQTCNDCGFCQTA